MQSFMKQAAVSLACGIVAAVAFVAFSAPANAQPSVVHWFTLCVLDDTLTCNQVACTTVGAACMGCTNVQTYGECIDWDWVSCTQYNWGPTGCGARWSGTCAGIPGSMSCAIVAPTGNNCQRFTCK